MPINLDIVDEVSQRYSRERDRFIKMTRLVEDMCDRYFIEKSRILVNITSRTKSTSSLRGKLLRFIDREEKCDWNNADDVFSGLSDFCGVRIAIYDNKVLEYIKSGIDSMFEIVDGFDEKDKNRHDSFLFYKAIHCQVHLKKSEIDNSDNENLEGIGCEIQICSMMAHVWNEIEHDISYKPSGQVSGEEREILKNLGVLTRQGDALIENLMKCHISRVKNEDRIDGAILADQIAEWFGIRRITFRNSIGDLTVILQQLAITERTVLRKALGLGQTEDLAASRALWASAKREIGFFNEYLRQQGDERYLLNERNSVDPAVWLIVKNLHNDILKKMAAGRGQGRPMKIRSIAIRYRNYVDHGGSQRRKKKK
jgi:ppGpp synthetase/RelA/SpoT-type nucleotidyltranferase